MITNIEWVPSDAKIQWIMPIFLYGKCPVLLKILMICWMVSFLMENDWSHWKLSPNSIKHTGSAFHCEYCSKQIIVCFIIKYWFWTAQNYWIKRFLIIVICCPPTVIENVGEAAFCDNIHLQKWLQKSASFQ